MSSIEELKELVAKMAIDSAKRSEDDAANIARMTEQNTRLIEALAAQPPGVQQVQQGGLNGQQPPAAVREDKLARLS